MFFPNVYQSELIIRGLHIYIHGEIANLIALRTRTITSVRLCVRVNNVVYSVARSVAYEGGCWEREMRHDLVYVCFSFLAPALVTCLF